MDGPLTRRRVLVAGIAGVAGSAALPTGCRILPGERIPADNPCVGEVPQRGDLQLSSPAFPDNGQYLNKSATTSRTSARR